MIFKIDFLPAKYGDSIWIEYGDKEKLYHILIDGGTAGTKVLLKERILNLPAARRHIDLIVVTHIDRDHIEGILGLLNDEELSFTVGDF